MANTTIRRRKRKRSGQRIPINRYPFTPATYPGRRPHFSFFFTASGIYRIKPQNLNRFLANRGLPPVTKRFAVLAYGSNACPGQLERKYSDHGLTDIPVLYGRLTGAYAVYAKRKTNRGYVPATLARRKGSRSSWVTLLTKAQLAAMDRSEGRHLNTYVLAEIAGVQFTIGRKEISPLYSYVDIGRGVMIHKGKPVSLHSTSQKRALSLLATSTEDDAANWFDFKTIPGLNAPTRHSQIRKR